MTRLPAGFLPLPAVYARVLGAGHVEAHGPTARTHPAEYNTMAERFVEQHKCCDDLQRGLA